MYVFNFYLKRLDTKRFFKQKLSFKMYKNRSKYVTIISSKHIIIISSKQCYNFSGEGFVCIL